MPKKKTAVAQATQNQTAITMVDPNLCHPSPANNRFDREAALDELIESIRAQGLLQFPILRPHPTIDGQYEIVAGERRCRACAEIGMEMPAVVRDLSDKDAHQITITENMQREQLSPLEDAAGIATLIADGMTIPEVAEKIGKSVSWTARRAKLHNLSPLWKETIQNRKDGVALWSTSHLELIARFEHQIQDRMYIKKFRYSHYAEIPVVRLKQQIEEYMMALAGAPWSLKDAKLLKSAGPCSGCVERSSVQTELFDTKPQADDYCLDCECWREKMGAHIAAKAKELTKANSNLAFIDNGYWYGDDDSYLPKDHPLREKALRGDEIDECEPEEEGAIPALIIGGNKAGQVRYIKPPKVDQEEEDREETAEEREGRIEEQRCKLVKSAVADQIEAAVNFGKLGSVKLEHQLYFVMTMCDRDECFGNYYEDEEAEDSDETPFGYWAPYLRMIKDQTAVSDVITRLFTLGLQEWVEKLRTENRWRGASMDDTIQLCNIMEIDFAALSGKAREEITE